MNPETKLELIRITNNSIKLLNTTQIQDKMNICKLCMIKYDELNQCYCNDLIILGFLQTIKTIFEI